MAPQDMPELERWILHRLAELDHKVRTGYAAYDFQGVFRALFDFCTVDLSAVYFDIRKDALYCDGPTLRRNSARTVLDLLFHRLTTWLAPILVFTRRRSGSNASPGGQLRPPRRHASDARGLARRTARGEVGRHPPRPPRGDGGARSPAAGQGDRGEPRSGAVVHVADPEVLKALKSLDFADICITSGLVLTADPIPQEAFRLPEVDGVGVVFEAAEGEKCLRCWKISPTWAPTGTRASAPDATRRWLRPVRY